MSTTAQLFTGTITKVETRLFDHPDPYVDRYSTSRVTKQLKLLVSFVDDEGQSFWFYSPGVNDSVSCPVGCPIAVHLCDSNDWIDGSEERAVAEAGKPNSGIKGPKVKAGERITVKAKVKRETQFGTQIFYTKLISSLPVLVED